MNGNRLLTIIFVYLHFATNLGSFVDTSLRYRLALRKIRRSELRYGRGWAVRRFGMENGEQAGAPPALAAASEVRRIYAARARMLEPLQLRIAGGDWRQA